MTQKLFYSLTTALILFALYSCGESKKEKATPSPINPQIEEIDNIPDSALLVALDRVEGDSIIVTVEETKEQQAFGYRMAKLKSKIHGSMTPGNILSIFPESKTKSILMSINVTEMKGKWIYDTKQHVGFVFEEKGGLSSINSRDISFRQWKLLNGHLYIYYVDAQQVADERHQYLVDKAEIRSLTATELVLKFRNKNLVCSRQTEVIKFHTKNSK